MRRISSACLVLALSSGYGCIESFEPDVGPLQKENCFNEDSNPDVDVSFSQDIMATFFDGKENIYGCNACHDPVGMTPTGFEASGLDLSTYAATRAGGDRSGTAIVIPGRPCDSFLLLKTFAGPPVGGRMPLNGAPFLTAEETQLLHDWIAEGALDN